MYRIMKGSHFPSQRTCTITVVHGIAKKLLGSFSPYLSYQHHRKKDVWIQDEDGFARSALLT